ncbi:helix-turn-helix domain-containing protein [Streptomyces nodosus]
MKSTKFRWLDDIAEHGPTGQAGYRAKNVGRAMWVYADKDGGSIRPSHERLARDMSTSVDTVARGVATLVETGWLAVRSKARPGRAALYALAWPVKVSKPQVVELERSAPVRTNETDETDAPQIPGERSADSDERSARVPRMVRTDADPTDQEQTITTDQEQTTAAPVGAAPVVDVWSIAADDIAERQAEAMAKEFYEELSTRHLLERFELGAPVGGALV